MMYRNAIQRIDSYKSLTLFLKGIAMSTTTFAAAPVSTNALAATIAGTAKAQSLSNVFRMKPAASAVEKAVSTITSPGVQQAISMADSLVQSYAKLRVDVLDRSDRALWNHLGEVYAYADSVERSPLKRETRTELIRQIRLRGGAGVSTTATTAAVVVRYIFADQSRQTCSNYAIAMEKAAALGVTTDTFAGFLEQYGGVSKVVEHLFDHEAAEAAISATTAKQLAEQKQARTGLVGRLCAALAHVSTTEIEYRDELNVWVPEKPEKKTKSADKEEKVDPKFEQGNFVVFLTVKNPQTGKYRVVQGNVFNRAFEEQLLGTIANHMDADNDELAQTVVGLEQAITAQ